ncbi:type II secretion system F family protein [Patescibacteria group bacterium]|nr:type II secretion system F family protein [Patescibacteria group bacterium]MCL5409928.1 type II secretion system F family protein [Patescibacteria group bacterium]
MPIFNYIAKDLTGSYHKGEIETTDDRQAATLLRRKKLIVISLKVKNTNKDNFVEKFFSKVAYSDVVVFTRQLATMVEAGLVLSEALDILQEQQSDKNFQKIIGEISNDVKGGMDFATSLEKYPEVFPKLYSKLVRAGQASGKLDTVLLQLADNLEKDREFRSKIRGAMIYPIVVLLMMAGVMLIMIFFVMPKLMNLYTDSGLDLPLPTKILLAFTNFMLTYWWIILLILVVGILTFRRYIKSPSGKYQYDTVVLKLPVVGRIVTLVTLTNFTRTFGLLASSGIPILESIKIVGEIVGNSVFQSGLETAYKGVERGLTLSSQILAMPVFPRIVGQMIKTGEETGKIDEIMIRLANYFETESDNQLKNVTTLIEPIILVILGVGVAFLVISIILPIYQLTTNIQ